MKRYFDSSMGSQDAYTCPLCYSQIHRTMVDPEADINDDTIANESVYDPMHVLGTIDDDNFEVASLFCFTRAADVKKHLQKDHNVQTKGIEGNDLYSRYKIRAPDGLLQRWLARKYGQVKQGYMRMYWNEGNNQSFILLLDLMKRAKAYSDLLLDADAPEDEKEEAENFLSGAQDFYDTFASNTHTRWTSISSPFMKNADNMKDFIAEDDEIEESSDDGETNHMFLHRKLAAKDDESDENDLVHKLQRKYAGENGEQSDDSDQSSEEELEIVDKELSSSDGEGKEDDPSKMTGYYSPVEQETDAWVVDKMNKRKRKTTPPSSAESRNSANGKVTATSSKEREIGKKLANVTPVGKVLQRKSASSATKNINSQPIQLSATKRTPAIRDSDDED